MQKISQDTQVWRVATDAMDRLGFYSEAKTFKFIRELGGLLDHSALFRFCTEMEEYGYTARYILYKAAAVGPTVGCETDSTLRAVEFYAKD